MDKKTAVITGASSGIGKALALNIAQKGYNLIIFGRRTERLTELKNLIEEKHHTSVHIESCDIRDSDAMKRALNRAVDKFGGLDLIFANAGFTIPGSFENLNADAYKNIFDTNFCGMLNTLYPALPELKKSHGTIIIIGSILGEFGIMERSAYVATKFALRGFYESVRYELKESGVKFLLVEPGFVKTELRYMDNQGNRLEIVTDKTVKKTSHGIAATAEFVADKIIAALPKKGFKKKIITGHAKAFAFLNWFCPRLLSTLVYKYRDFLRKKVVK